MAINPLLALQVQPPQFEAPGNALARVMALRNAQQSNALQMMQMQRMQQQAQEEAQAREAAAQQQQRQAEQAQLARNYLDSISPSMGPAQPVDLVRALQFLPRETVADLAKYTAPDFNAPEIASWQEQAGPDGMPVRRGYTKTGMPVGEPLSVPIKRERVDTGAEIVLVNPYAPGGPVKKAMSPGERDASARGWAGVNIARDAEARQSRESINKLGPADPMKAPAPGSQTARVQDATDVLQLLAQAEPLIEKSTGSYIGAGMDQVGRVFGSATSGAEANSRLKVLEGLLISKMPKMSGPQSDKDVMLYKQMAGQIGDPTIPASMKKLALQEIRTINERYAGAQPLSVPPVNTRAGVPGVKFLGFEK